MNRTFLILLMIGTAMMIAVIGEKESTVDLDYVPWEVDRLENGSIRVFGLTLGKTTIQDANQIFASFADTRLSSTQLEDGTQTLQLIAIYENLTIGGLVAEIQLTYQLDAQNLQEIYNNLMPTDETSKNQPIVFYKIKKETEIKHLSTAISSITYIPSIDYDHETIRQRFGLAAEELKFSDTEERWRYPDLGLKIYIHKDKPDLFVYNTLK